MSSGHSEGPSTNPDDWKSPYGTGPGQPSGYDRQPYYEQPQSHPSEHNQTGGYPAGYGRGYGEPGVYGQPYAQGYGAQSYGQGYGAQPYGQGYAPPPQPGNEGVRTHAVVALVVSIVMAMSCYVSLGGITGAILSGIALGKVDTDVRTARNLLKWTWISIGANVALIVLGIVAFIIAGINGAFD
ncbi:hypothetical protein GCM10010517_32630 [Streptosporangium fragile]|uniref:DUF4190 domain-containing protein n=1 Tax=Streptosporangium fragile TaxID=46186 RepID=A0ABN3VYG1_9ACTN